jgi:hypothetical protein
VNNSTQYTKTVFFDLSSLEGDDDWRKRMTWPFSQQENLDLFKNMMRCLVEAVRDIDDAETARIAEASLPRAYHFIYAALHGACVVDASNMKKLCVKADTHEIRYLMGELPLDSIPDDFFESMFLLPTGRPLDWLRTLAFPRFWTSWLKLPMTLLAPQSTAIGYNHMMNDWIKNKCLRVNYIDPKLMLRKELCRLDSSNVEYKRAEIAAECMVSALTIPNNMDEDLKKRLKDYLSYAVHTCTRKIAEMQTAFKAVRKLPMHALNATGGNLAAGLLANEILRRGGEVTGFDHTTGRGLERNVEYTVLLEAVFTSKFVVSTEKAAVMFNRLCPERLLHPRHSCKIVGGTGYPTIRSLDFNKRIENANPKLPRVTYASPQFRGIKQANPPTTADPVQLDWELRLVDILQKLPIKLICRPHPEGLFQGKPHPLAKVAKTSEHVFEDLISETDVFLFDWFRTSTLWAALCTDKPIIMIELGYSYLDAFFTDEIRDAIQQRMRFVRAGMDERNRVVIDRDILADAIFTATETVDSSLFREILIDAA